MDLVDALKFCGGAARWSRLVELEVPRRQLELAPPELRSGHGVYALSDASPAFVAAVKLRSRPGATGLPG